MVIKTVQYVRFPGENWNTAKKIERKIKTACPKANAPACMRHGG
jgi:hypothetical protein